MNTLFSRGYSSIPQSLFCGRVYLHSIYTVYNAYRNSKKSIDHANFYRNTSTSKPVDPRLIRKLSILHKILKMLWVKMVILEKSIGAQIYIAVAAVPSWQIKVTKKSIYHKPGNGAKAVGVFSGRYKQVISSQGPEARISPHSGRMNNLWVTQLRSERSCCSMRKPTVYFIFF